jgi:hypothetical protein
MRWFVAIVCALAGVIAAAPAALAQDPMGMTVASGPVAAGFGFASDADPIMADKKKKPEEDGEAPELTPEEEALAERMKAIDAAAQGELARVVVLKWPEKDTDYKNETVQRNIRSRIARPDATFFPEIDLYQSGRRERRRGAADPSIRPLDQRAVVPASAIPMMQDAADRTAVLAWNSLSYQDWSTKADELRGLLDEVWFVDRPDLREPLFNLYIQIGRAADSRNNTSPPYFAVVGTRETVNYYWYLAGALAAQEPELLSKVTDQDLHASISYNKELIDSGAIDRIPLSFELEGVFDPGEFTKEYRVFINGIEVTVEAKDSLYRVPPGRTDVYLKRSDDGHSLSERIDTDKFEDEVVFIRDIARKKMGTEFIKQLMVNPNECIPDLDGDIVTFLAIYGKLHPKHEVYIAVPNEGNPNKIYLWRWDKVAGVLKAVYDETGHFPVRFALLFDVGTEFSGVGVSASIADDGQIATIDPNSASPESVFDFTPTLQLSGVPIDLQLRGHLNRFLVLAGTQWVWGAQGKWGDFYHTNFFRTGDFATTSTLANVAGTTESTETETVDCVATPDDPACQEQDGLAVALKRRPFSTMWYGGAGVVFGRNASVGFGPRLWLRGGYHQIPNILDFTLHGGIAAQPPFSEAGGRVRPLVDLDAYAGTVVPLKYSVLARGFGGQRVYPNFGFTAGLGVTF